jgi:hypothetical protein
VALQSERVPMGHDGVLYFVNNEMHNHAHLVVLPSSPSVVVVRRIVVVEKLCEREGALELSMHIHLNVKKMFD